MSTRLFIGDGPFGIFARGRRAAPPMPSAFSSAARAIGAFVRPGPAVAYTIAAVYVPAELISQVLMRTATGGGKHVVIAALARAACYAAAGALSAPALVFLFEREGVGGPRGLTAAKEALSSALGVFPRSLCFRTFAFVLTLAGSLLFVVPGVVLLCMSALVDPVVALEPGGQNAWSRSRRLTRGMRSHTLAAGAVLGVACALAALPILVAHNAVAGSAGDTLAAASRTISAGAAPDAMRATLEAAASIFRQVLTQTLTSLFTALAYVLYRAASAREGRAG